MRTATWTRDPSKLALHAGAAAVLVVVALWIGRAPLPAPLLAAAGVVLFLLVLLSAEAGLILLIASMLLSPEIPLAALGGRDLEGSRSLVLRADDLVLVIVGLAWLARTAIHKDLAAVRRSPLNLPIASYILACALATLVGMVAGTVRPLLGACFLVKYVEFVLVFFITVNYVRGEARLRRLLAAALVVAGLLATWGLARIPAGGRPSAPFEGTPGEPNTFGGYLVLMFCVAAGIALARPGRRWTGAARLLALILPLPILATLSRGSWIALAVALVTLLALAPARRGLAAAVLAGATLLVLVSPQAVADRVAATFEGDHRSLQIGAVRLDASASARVESWSASLSGWARRPLLGWGITGYGFIDAQYFRLLVETGLVGAAAFAWMIAVLARLFRSASRDLPRPLERGLALGMCAGLAALLAHGLSTNTFMLIRIMEPFWLLTGLVVAAPGAREVPA